MHRRRDRVRLRYGVGGPARLSASDCCSGSLMEYSYYGPLDVGNSGLERPLQKGKDLDDNYGARSCRCLSCKGRQHHSTSTAWQDASKKTGAAPASSDSVDGADELAQAKREMGIVKSKRARKGKERKGSFRKSKAWFLFRSWSVCECDEKVGRSLVRLEECALSVCLMQKVWC